MSFNTVLFLFLRGVQYEYHPSHGRSTKTVQLTSQNSLIFCNYLNIPQSLDVNYTISTLLDSVSLNFDAYPAYPDKLKEWLSFWNVSNATQVPWGSVKSNVSPYD